MRMKWQGRDPGAEVLLDLDGQVFAMGAQLFLGSGGRDALVGQLGKLRAGCLPAPLADCQSAAGFQPAPQTQFTLRFPKTVSLPRSMRKGQLLGRGG
jgi:hypothetical protein